MTAIHLQLQDIWTSEILKAHADGGSEGKAKVDVNAWLNKVTLDIIGLAGACAICRRGSTTHRRT